VRPWWFGRGLVAFFCLYYSSPCFFFLIHRCFYEHRSRPEKGRDPPIAEGYLTPSGLFRRFGRVSVLSAGRLRCCTVLLNVGVFVPVLFQVVNCLGPFWAHFGPSFSRLTEASVFFCPFSPGGLCLHFLGPDAKRILLSVAFHSGVCFPFLVEVRVPVCFDRFLTSLFPPPPVLNYSRFGRAFVAFPVPKTPPALAGAHGFF